MGKYDSSKYRVVPLVETIKCNKTNFDLFLKTIHTQKEVPDLECPMTDNAYFYGGNEKQLKPTSVVVAYHFFNSEFLFEKQSSSQ